MKAQFEYEGIEEITFHEVDTINIEVVNGYLEGDRKRLGYVVIRFNGAVISLLCESIKPKIIIGGDDD